MMKFVLIFCGGGIGSVIRYIFTRAGERLLPGVFPWGTFAANVVSCLLLAVFIMYKNSRIPDNQTLSLFIVTGFCGGLSTFSTFSMETAELIRKQYWLYATGNIGLSLLSGILILYCMIK